MLLDANLLLYAVNTRSVQHEAARTWLTDQMNGSRRVGIPWQSLGAFLRIATHPRGFEHPLSSADAWARLSDWLSAPASWVPAQGTAHAEILGELIRAHDIRGNLVPDAQLAALALEHGLTICSADSDFARFPEIRWLNPLT